VSDPILLLSNLQSPVFLLNSRLGLFTAPLLQEGLFSRSYETILPSSLATNHSSALGYSPRLPVSVYGTGSIYLKLRGFSWKLAWGLILNNRSYQNTIVFHLICGFAYRINNYALQPGLPSPGRPYASPSPHRSIYKCRNINRLSISFALRLHLRSRLTLI
jgi:hypothetical protein